MNKQMYYQMLRAAIAPDEEQNWFDYLKAYVVCKYVMATIDIRCGMLTSSCRYLPVELCHPESIKDVMQ